MPQWTIPVFDRTLDDVEEAKEQIALWKKQGITNPNIELKGCLNPTDMNRIEGDMEYIGTIFHDEHIIPSLTYKTDWGYNDIIDLVNINRILDNLEVLVEASVKISKDIPSTMRTYEEINTIEEYLAEVFYYVSIMVRLYLICNTFHSGTRNFLPLKRGGI